MKIGCNTVSWRKYDLKFSLERIARAGYKYVEVEGNLSWCDHVRTDQDDPVKFRDKVMGFGFLGISCIGSHRELITEPAAEEDIRRSLEFAQAAGVPVVATGEGRLPEGMSQEEALGVLQPKFQRLVETAEKCKVCLAIEPHGSLSLSPGGLEKLMALAPSEFLGVNFDTANPKRGDYVGTTHEGYGWKLDEAARGDEVATLRPVVNKVRHVHLKDVVGRDAVVLGQGEVRLKELVTMLKQAGFKGVLSFETEGAKEADEAEEMAKKSRVWTEDLLEEMGIKAD